MDGFQVTSRTESDIERQRVQGAADELRKSYPDEMLWQFVVQPQGARSPDDADPHKILDLTTVIVGNFAKVLRSDDRIARLLPGKFADFTLWDQHVFDSGQGRIPDDIHLRETWIGGVKVYERVP